MKVVPVFESWTLQDHVAANPLGRVPGTYTWDVYLGQLCSLLFLLKASVGRLFINLGFIQVSDLLSQPQGSQVDRE